MLKVFYSYLNNKIGRMKAPVTLKDDDGNVLGEQDSVDVFAEYFHSVYLKDNDFLPHSDKRSNVLLSNIEINVVEVDRRLQTLPSKYSSGLNNTPNIFLQNLHSLLALPLSLIFQQRINIDCLSKLWKCADISSLLREWWQILCRIF